MSSINNYAPVPLFEELFQSKPEDSLTYIPATVGDLTVEMIEWAGDYADLLEAECIDGDSFSELVKEEAGVMKVTLPLALVLGLARDLRRFGVCIERKPE